MLTYTEVREFCIRKLAHILYENVACSHADRALLDWQTAEWFVDRSKTVVDCIYHSVETLSVLSPECVQDSAALDRLWGRVVWTGLYQPLKKVLGLPYESNESVPHYTHIRFG